MRSRLLAAALLALGTRAAAQDAPPPPATRSLYVLDVPFLHFGALDLAPVAPARVTVDVDAAYANTWAHTWHAFAIQREFHLEGRPFERFYAEKLHERHPHDAITFIDADVTRVAFTGRLGLTRALSVSLEVPWVSFAALRGDAAVESVHGRLGITDPGRESFPRNRFQIVRQRPDGALEFDDRAPGAGFGDVVARASYRGRAGAATRFGLDLAVKLPTGSADDYRGSGSADVGLLAGVSRRLSSRLEARLEAGLVVPGRFRGDVPTTLGSSAFARALAGLEMRLGRKTFVSLAGVWEQAPYRKDAAGDSGRASGEVVFGVARELSPRVRASLGITENLPSFGDAADIAVLLSLSAR